MELNIKFDEKLIVETANRVLDEYEYNGKTIREWADLIANPKTNADRIRDMSDEELAEWLSTFCICGEREDICPAIGCKGCGAEDCDVPWLDWLRQEVSTDG